MPLEPISVTTIEDGAPLRAIDGCIEEAVRDIIQRDTLEQKRVCILQVEITPKIESSEGMRVCMPEVAWHVKTKVPAHAGVKTRAHLRNTKSGVEMMVRTSDPYEDNPNQTTLFDRETDKSHQDADRS